MKWLTQCLCKRPLHAERPRAGTLQLEELEARRMLSASTFAVASGIINSAENFGDFVSGEYYSLLGRAPDRAGVYGWVSQMENGLAPEAVEAAFVASAEYVQNHGNAPVAWLDGLYHDLLNRAADIGGLDSWIAALAGGASTYDVALGIATSVESQSMVVEQDYQLFLGRNADPNGLAHWVNQMQEGLTRAEVAVDIAASDEYFANSNHDPTQFIVDLYQDALNRAPDHGEINTWLVVYGH